MFGRLGLVLLSFTGLLLMYFELIMSGAAILQSILSVWPTELLTVADRGLREGILYSQMVKQGYLG